nr:hypothetical protein [Tanacetum cinerariifolium]
MTKSSQPISMLFLDQLDVDVSGKIVSLMEPPPYVKINKWVADVIGFVMNVGRTTYQKWVEWVVKHATFMLEFDRIEPNNTKYLIDVTGFVMNVGRTTYQKSCSMTLNFYLADLSYVLLSAIVRFIFVCTFTINFTHMKQGPGTEGHAVGRTGRCSDREEDKTCWDVCRCFDFNVCQKLQHVDESSKAVVPVEFSQPKEGTLENVLIWARNRKNDTATFHCKVMIESVRTKKGWNYPSCGGGTGLNYVTDDTAHVVIILFDELAIELVKCSAESLLASVDEKINSTPMVEEGARSSMVDENTENPSLEFKRLAQTSFACTPSKGHEEKKRKDLKWRTLMRTGIMDHQRSQLSVMVMHTRKKEKEKSVKFHPLTRPNNVKGHHGMRFSLSSRHVGFESRPPILNKENYVPWSSRLLRYAKSRPNRKLIHNSILNGPYVRRMISEPGDANREVNVTETFHMQTYDELFEKELKQIEDDDQVIQTILLGLPEDIYAAVDSCETAQEIWLRVQQMMKGSDIGIQEKKAKMESTCSIVHQTKDLHTVDYTQLYDFLKYNQKEQASTSSTQTDSAPVYDSDGSAENDNDVISEDTSVEQGRETVEQHPANFEETHTLYESLYQNLAIEVEKVNLVNRKLKETNADLTTELARFKNQTRKKRLKSDFKTREDELLDKQIQLEKKIKELNNILLKTGQWIQTIHMLSPKPDSFYHTEQKMALGYQNPFYLKQAQKKQQSLYDGKVLLEKHDPPVVHDSNGTLQLAQETKFVGDFKSLTNEVDASLAKHKALELEIERLLKAVVSQDIMNIMQKESVVDTSDLQTELERMKERFENCIIKKENEYAKLWILAQLRDLKGKSKDTSCVSDTRNPLSQKLENKNVELEFQVSDQKDNTHDTSANIKFAKQPIVENIPKVGETNALSKPVTSNSISTSQESKGVNNDKVIAPGMFRINPFKTSREEKHVPNTVNYARENAHLKATYKNLFDSISVSRAQTKTIIASLQNELQSNIYKNAKLRTQLFKKVSDQKDNTGYEVDNTKTRRPQPSSNTKNDRVPSASKSSRSKNKGVEVEEHHRNLLLSKNNKHMSSACNNIKLDSQNVISKVVCAMCKKCLIYVNHDVCLRNYVNGKNSRGRKHKANVSIKEKQKKHQPHVKKPKKVIQICLWCVDSGCSKYMTGNLKLLINFVWKFMGTVHFRNDHVAAILGFGDLQWGNILITRFYFIEGLGHNLFSVRQFCDSDLEAAFRRNACFVRSLEGVYLLKRDRSTNLHTINLHEMASTWQICLPKFKYHKEHLCPSCEQGKSKRATHPPKPVPNSRQRLHLLHMDLYGPMRIASINGKRYVLLIMDDYSRYMWVHFLRSKDEAPEVIKTFLKRITVLLQSPVIIIRIDNGTKFKNQVLKEYFDSVGISHQMSSVRTPQQNGVVERRNRMLVEAARTMLIFSRATLFLWAEGEGSVWGRLVEVMGEMWEVVEVEKSEGNGLVRHGGKPG